MSLQKYIQKLHNSSPKAPHSLSSINLLTNDDRLFIIKQVVLSLLYLHLYYDSPIIHGNLCPLNIYLEENYDVKIASVGWLLNPENLDIEKYIDQSNCYNYIAPECFSNQKSIFTDIFSFGWLVYEIYTGEKPYTYNCLDEYLQKGMSTSYFYRSQSYLREKMFTSMPIVIDRDIDWNEKLPPKISYLIKKWLSYEHFDRPHILEIADFLEAL